MTKLDYGPFVPERIAEWAYWIRERENIRIRKAKDARLGKFNPPYSEDQVMANTRWCCVRRMDDKVSIWLMENWYDRKIATRDRRLALVAALAARMINRPETLSHITGGKPFSKFSYDTFRSRMLEVKASGAAVFTGAYIINAAEGGSKIDYVCRAFRQAYEAKPFTYIDTSSLEKTAANLHSLPGVGSFISGQVVADLRWVLTDEFYWQDKMTWAPPGPGSSKGMKYLLGLLSANEMDGRGKDMTALQFQKYLPPLIRLAKAHPVVGPVFRERALEAHDIQNSLCETSKYVRVKNGGHAKNNYPPKTR